MEKLNILILLILFVHCLSYNPFIHGSLYPRRLLRAASGTDFNWETMKKETGTKMSKSTESIQAKLGTIRANGANVAMFENIVVKGANAMSTKLRQISSISVANAMKVTIQPFDHSQIKNIEEAVCNSGLQLRAECSDDGVLNIHIPPLTEERRNELAKYVRTVGEEGKVSIRNVRRDTCETLKSLEKAKAIGKDVSKTCQDDLQKVTDSYVKKLDEIIKAKEKELLKK